MKIYTKTGDDGETTLYGGTRVAKDSLRVWCYGSVDEANCALGMAAVQIPYENIQLILRQIQQKLFILGAELASDAEGIGRLSTRITADDIAFLENVIDETMAEHGPITRFLIPGETVPSGLLHVARVTVRLAERYVTSLAKTEEISPLILAYLNRLSDALFALSYAVLCKEMLCKEGKQDV